MRIIVKKLEECKTGENPSGYFKVSEPYVIDRAKEILKDRRNHTIAEVENAENILESQVIKEDGLPF